MCATSIGLTFSHMPSPGVRKSGIPDGTEIPAPVRATARCASASSCATRSADAVVVGIAAISLGSAALEVSLPLAEERADAFLRVLRLERRREPFRLRLQ